MCYPPFTTSKFVTILNNHEGKEKEKEKISVAIRKRNNHSSKRHANALLFIGFISLNRS